MAAIKKVGRNGQISLGKKYAGKMVMLDQMEEGVWVVKIGRFVPDSEKWLYARGQEEKLEEAIKWAEENPAKETDLEVLEARIK
ncbi:MAG: hypothetical protein JRJ48_02400 [Deltaproteobacteria bacterium]|nr:hypothetical protein [Deltaproteobacteria bacterium]